jgi:hypothetical protein
MLTADHLRYESNPSESGIARIVRYVMLASPFVVKLVVGFEWAVLVAFFVATEQIRFMLRAVIVDTTSLNLMKQHEQGLYTQPTLHEEELRGAGER